MENCNKQLVKQLNRRDFLKASLIGVGAIALGELSGCITDSFINKPKDYWAWVSKEINGKVCWGCINRQGDYVVSPKFIEGEQVAAPKNYSRSPIGNYQSNGLAMVTNGFEDSSKGVYGLTGCIDTSGDFVIEQKFASMFPFDSNGLAPAASTDRVDAISPNTNKPFDYHPHGYIDKKGAWRIEPRFAWAGGFSDNGYAMVEDPTTVKNGYIGRDGNYLIQPQFVASTLYTNAFQQQECAELNGVWWALVTIDDWRGFIDEQGNRVVTISDEVSTGQLAITGEHFGPEGLIIAKNRKNLYGYIGIDGNYAIAPIYYDAGIFQNGLAVVTNTLKLKGMIDASGGYVITMMRKDLHRFQENGLACVQGDSGRWGLVNTSGVMVLTPAFGYICTFNEDGTCFANNDTKGISGSDWFLINSDGEAINEQKFAEIGFGYWIGGLCPVKTKKDGPWGFVNTRGELVIEPQFSKVNGFFEAP